MVSKLKEYAKAAVAAVIATAGANILLVQTGEWDLRHFVAAEIAAALTAVGVALTTNAPAAV